MHNDLNFTLNYVNLPDRDVIVETDFKNAVELMDWVQTNHPNFTSYQVIVTKA